MVSYFIDALSTECGRQNGTVLAEASSFDLSNLGETSGVIRYRNLYCQYKIVDYAFNHAIVLSIGWFGEGFHLSAAPDLEFILDDNAWHEKTNPLMRFETSHDLAAFCVAELKNNAQQSASMGRAASRAYSWSR